jgi:acyl-CoA synthetase (AMP-forming)/AMP-acid ligase II
MLPTGIDFFSAFFGILYVGAVPVPIYPPMQRSQIEDYAVRQAGILRNAGARMLITVPEGLKLGALLQAWPRHDRGREPGNAVGPPPNLCPTCGRATPPR